MSSTPRKSGSGPRWSSACWVREMSDEAYMALMLDNAQGELLPLEEGMHALQSGLGGTEYARRTGMKQATLKDRICAARVAQAVSGYPLTDLADSWQALTAIHAAQEWLWPALVEGLLADDWTVEVTKGHKEITRWETYQPMRH